MKCCVRPNSGPRNSGEFSDVPDSDLKPVLLQYSTISHLKQVGIAKKNLTILRQRATSFQIDGFTLLKHLRTGRNAIWECVSRRKRKAVHYALRHFKITQHVTPTHLSAARSCLELTQSSRARKVVTCVGVPFKCLSLSSNQFLLSTAFKETVSPKNLVFKQKCR